MGPLLRRRRHRPGSGVRVPGRAHRPCRPRHGHVERPLREPRVLRGLPTPRGPGQVDRHHRQLLGRSGHARSRRGMAPGRVRRVRHPVPAGAGAAAPARGDRAVRPRAPHRGVRRLRRRVLPAARRPLRAQAETGAAADLARRPRREGHVEARCPLRRRLERDVREPRDVPPQDGRPRRALRRHRARPSRDHEVTQPRARLARGGPRRPVRSDGRLPTRLGAHRQHPAGRRPWSAPTPMPAPTRSTSRCARPSTSTASSASPRRCSRSSECRPFPRPAAQLLDGPANPPNPLPPPLVLRGRNASWKSMSEKSPGTRPCAAKW